MIFFKNCEQCPPTLDFWNIFLNWRFKWMSAGLKYFPTTANHLAIWVIAAILIFWNPFRKTLNSKCWLTLFQHLQTVSINPTILNWLRPQRSSFKILHQNFFNCIFVLISINWQSLMKIKHFWKYLVEFFCKTDLQDCMFNGYIWIF